MTIGAVARDIRSYHELLFQFIRRDISVRYRQAVMGFAWAILLPTLTIGAGLILRVVAFKGSPNPPPIAGIAIKAWAWAFVVGGLTFGSQSLLSNIQLVTKIYFPREVLPTAAILTQCFDSLIGLTLVVVALPFLHATFGWQLLWFPVLVLLLIALVLGLSLLLAAANIFFRDVKYLVQLVITFGLFFMPIAYDPARFHGLARTAIMLNPFSGVLVALDLTVTRNMSLTATHVIVTGVSPAGANVTGVLWQPADLLPSIIGAVVLMLVGVSVFRRGAAWFAEVW
jgi:homopolymeric O-antigen transport system permease protein